MDHNETSCRSHHSRGHNLSEEERWTEVEEQLLAKTSESRHAERRWKHFAK